MPNPVNARHGQQWTTCDRCGFLFPMARLAVQKGLLVCNRRTCVDNLEVERRSLVIERLLNSGVEQEGVDLRMIDRGFFLGQNEEVF